MVPDRRIVYPVSQTKPDFAIIFIDYVVEMKLIVKKTTICLSGFYNGNLFYEGPIKSKESSLLNRGSNRL